MCGAGPAGIVFEGRTGSSHILSRKMLARQDVIALTTSG